MITGVWCWQPSSFQLFCSLSSFISMEVFFLSGNMSSFLCIFLGFGGSSSSLSPFSSSVIPSLSHPSLCLCSGLFFSGLLSLLTRLGVLDCPHSDFRLRQLSGDLDNLSIATDSQICLSRAVFGVVCTLIKMVCSLPLCVSRKCMFRKWVFFLDAISFLCSLPL